MHLEENLRCPWCDTPFTERSVRCDVCGKRFQGRDHILLDLLLSMVKAYRVWSLALFGFAVFHLIAIGQLKTYYAFFLIAFPFGMALSISYRMGNATSRWIVVFLILVDFGVVIGPEHQILPILNLFPEMPRTQNRILTWYFLVYATLQFVVVPPVVFFKSLRTAWRGEQPALEIWICLLGLAVWGFIIFILVMLAVENMPLF
jgi:hypothetical protein